MPRCPNIPLGPKYPPPEASGSTDSRTVGRASSPRHIADNQILPQQRLILDLVDEWIPFRRDFVPSENHMQYP